MIKHAKWLRAIRIGELSMFCFCVGGLLSGGEGAFADTPNQSTLPQIPLYDRPSYDGQNQNSPSSSLSGTCHLAPCRVLMIDDVQVPALEEGPLVSVLVQDGAFVQKGAVLAHIDDRKSQLEKRAAEKELQAALTRSSDDIEVRFAQASFDAANTELQHGLNLNSIRQRAISSAEIRRRRLEAYKSELEIDKSRLNLKVAKMSADISQATVELADESMRRRRIIAPIDGVVMPVYRGQDDQRVCQVGQWVQSGEPVLRIVRMDRLFVEGTVNADEFNPSELDGRKVVILAELARGVKQQLEGQIVFISPEVDARNYFRVRAEVHNRTENGHWLLRPGAETSMTVQLR